MLFHYKDFPTSHTFLFIILIHIASKAIFENPIKFFLFIFYSIAEKIGANIKCMKNLERTIISPELFNGSYLKNNERSIFFLLF